jgi:hypothetical protein
VEAGDTWKRRFESSGFFLGRVETVFRDGGKPDPLQIAEQPVFPQGIGDQLCGSSHALLAAMLLFGALGIYGRNP